MIIIIYILYKKLCLAEDTAVKHCLLASRDAGINDGTDALQQECQSNRQTDRRNTHPRIHHTDESGNHQNDTDG